MLEPHNVRFCGARQAHKGHTWYDRGGKKLWCDGREARDPQHDPQVEAQMRDDRLNP